VEAELTGDLVHGLALPVGVDNVELFLGIEVTLRLNPWPRRYELGFIAITRPDDRGQKAEPFSRVMSREVHHLASIAWW
jgi:hypothetical protein